MRLNKLKRNQVSIQKKMIAYIWVCLLPILLLLLITLFSMYRYYQQYDRLITNITRANEYNIRFKDDIDETMYQIIIGSQNWTNPETKLAGEDPRGYIERARKHFEVLQETTEGAKVQADLKALLKLMGILDSHVEDVLANVSEGGHYDENMEMLDLNIRTLTDLIQEDIQVYINDEVASMESIRSSVSGHLMTTIAALIFLLLGMLLFALIMSQHLSDRITRPIRELCAATDSFARGDFSVRYHADSHDEIEKLAESFNSMVSELTILVEDIRTEQRNAKDAELRLLQEQINPHFLYNTLDTIIWLTEAGEKKESVQMTKQLSEFFRTTLSKGRNLVRVDEEENHIRSYLEIQQFRYRDIMTFEITFAPDILDCQIQKLTLQPIIENALYHGIKNHRGGGKITVTGRAEGEDIVFLVEDTGIGMKEEELASLKAVVEHNELINKERGFGMANVQARIGMFYGREYGLSIESTYGEGTLVTVRIPRRPYTGDEISGLEVKS